MSRLTIESLESFVKIGKNHTGNGETDRKRYKVSKSSRIRNSNSARVINQRKIRNERESNNDDN